MYAGLAERTNKTAELTGTVISEKNVQKIYSSLEESFKRHGKFCLAYSAFRKGISFFQNKELDGYIAYSKYSNPFLAPEGRRFVLANPVCPEEHADQMLSSFIENADEPAVFLQTDEFWAEKLRKRHFDIHQLGLDIRLDLQSFDLKGRKKAQLRHWLNKAEKEGIRFEEVAPAIIKTEEYSNLAKNWYSRKGGDSKFFMLTRPLELDEIPGPRVFAGRDKSSQLAAFIVFDPMYADGNIYGYYHNHIITKPDIPHGTTDYITMKAAELFKQEGASVISLGLAPLAGISVPENGQGRHVARISKFIYENCNFLYPFKNNYSHKKKYGADEVKVYCCTERKNSLREISAIMNFLKVF